MNVLAEILSYEFNQRALLAALMIGFMNGFVGGYVVMRRGALFAGALSHTLFPGIALGALIAGLNPYSALIGAFIMAMLVGLSAQGISIFSRVDRDASMAILMTAASAAGLLILRRVVVTTRIEDYLFGNILGIADWDLWFLFAAGALVLSLLVLLQRPLLVLIFSSEIAETHGISVKVMEHLLAAILIITMVASLQAVGALLTLGLFVAPASTLYLFSNSPRVILWGGATLGCTLAVGAVFISNLANVQTGPAMVILLAVVFLGGFIFSPRYGLLAVLRSKYLFFKHSK